MTEVETSVLREWCAQEIGFGEVARGRLLIVGGSRQTPGAVRLAAEAALRAGAEKVQLLTVRSNAPTLAVAVPELFVAGVEETPGGEIMASAFALAVEMAEQTDVVLVGPGFMSPQSAVDLCRPLLPRLRTKVVVDALAMAFFAAEPSFTFDDGQAVLTPNTGEVGLALDMEPAAVEKDPSAGAGRLSRRSNAVVSCGGSTTYVSTPTGRAWIDHSGHGGLAASGSGDVKAGLVAAALARFADPERAAVWGGHVHGLAGERVAARAGGAGYLASEVAAAVPEVVASLAGDQ